MTSGKLSASRVIVIVMAHPAPAMPARILLGDAHALFREALRIHLDSDRRFEVVGVASNGDEAIALADASEPDLVLLDAALPDALQATRRIHEHHSAVPILILGTASATPPQEAQEAGAAGFVRKDGSAAAVLASLPQVAAVTNALHELNPR
jgi:DNA-binding NarL/FixJ family response regulator